MPCRAPAPVYAPSRPPHLAVARPPSSSSSAILSFNLLVSKFASPLIFPYFRLSFNSALWSWEPDDLSSCITFRILKEKKKHRTHRKHGLAVSSPIMFFCDQQKDQDISSLSWSPRPRSMPERLWCQGPRGRGGRGPTGKNRHASSTPSGHQSIANWLDLLTKLLLTGPLLPFTIKYYPNTNLL